MATTDVRTGFRLPWSTDQQSAADDSARTDIASAATADPDLETPNMIEAAEAGTQRVGNAEPAAARTPRRPSKFLADLTKAMQATAESAREETLSRLQVDAKAHAEDVRARSATEGADLRRRADDDVAAIREWSKVEIARIRDETETKITARKGRLDTEIDEHAARIERQIERVQVRVSAFQEEMTTFFGRLLGEEDPGRFASMAENLPEPPPFDIDDAAMSATGPAVEVGDATWSNGSHPLDDLDEVVSLPTEGNGAAWATGAVDLDAAEAEALADAGADDDLGGAAVDSGARSTQLIVTGLVSVASIAGFKRHVGRLPDVESVGVSSGPDGAFVFTVAHAPGVDLREALPGIPGFDPRVSGGSARAIEVIATDPENQD